jgi:hypothetical protein
MLDLVNGFSSEGRGELALYNPLEAPWSDLPGRCVIMTHWPREGPLPALLEEHVFRVVTLARHPLDVLISILHYAPSGASLRWMEGAQGDERPIFGASPRSAAFLDYATGPRVRALLSVSPVWWSAPRCLRVRYEDLVRDPLGRLSKLTRSLERAPRQRLADAVASCTLDRLRTPETGRHFWKGQPGLWRGLLTAAEARRIEAVHRDVFRALGYACDPDESLDPEQADARWAELCSEGPAPNG